MKRYTVAKALTLSVGGLELTAAQAGPRKLVLEEVHVDADGAGIYRLVGRTQFKVGEEIGYDGDVPPRLRESLSPVTGADEATEAEAARDLTSAAHPTSSSAPEQPQPKAKAKPKAKAS